MFALRQSTKAVKSIVGKSYNMFGSFNNTVETNIDRNYNPNIIPKYWNGVIPHTIDFSKFTIDCQGKIPVLNDSFKD
jgi:hypothetical protein